MRAFAMKNEMRKEKNFFFRSSCCLLHFFCYFIAKCIVIFSSCSASFPAISCLFAELNHWISKMIKKRKMNEILIGSNQMTLWEIVELFKFILHTIFSHSFNGESTYIINVNFCFGGCLHERAIELLCKLFS